MSKEQAVEFLQQLQGNIPDSKELISDLIDRGDNEGARRVIRILTEIGNAIMYELIDQRSLDNVVVIEGILEALKFFGYNWASANVVDHLLAALSIVIPNLIEDLVKGVHVRSRRRLPLRTPSSSFRTPSPPPPPRSPPPAPRRQSRRYPRSRSPPTHSGYRRNRPYQREPSPTPFYTSLTQLSPSIPK